MSRLARFGRQAFDLKALHHCRARTLPFLSSFSTSATQSAAASEPNSCPYDAPPFGVSLTKNVGRACFATQPLPAGVILHTTRPVLSHPYLSVMNCVCYYCLRRLPQRDSSAESSHTVSFCSEDCEKNSKKFYDVEKQIDWSSFHEYCRDRGQNYPLLVKRLACQVISNKIPEDIFCILHGQKMTPEKVSLKIFELGEELRLTCDVILCILSEAEYMQRIYRIIYKVEEEFSMFESIIKEANISVEIDVSKVSTTDEKEENQDPLSFLTQEWYADALTRIRVNAFRVEVPAQSHEGEAGVGDAMYMLASFYNHSCVPNVSHVWKDNGEGQVVALRDIENEEELRLSYLDVSLGHEARQKILFERYGFHCDCPRCVAKE